MQGAEGLWGAVGVCVLNLETKRLLQASPGHTRKVDWAGSASSCVPTTAASLLSALPPEVLRGASIQGLGVHTAAELGAALVL